MGHDSVFQSAGISGFNCDLLFKALALLYDVSGPWHGCTSVNLTRTLSCHSVKVAITIGDGARATVLDMLICIKSLPLDVDAAPARETSTEDQTAMNTAKLDLSQC